MDKETLEFKLNHILVQLEDMQKEIINLANDMGIESTEVRSTTGDFLLGPILVAQANALAALANLKFL